MSATIHIRVNGSGAKERLVKLCAVLDSRIGEGLEHCCVAIYRAVFGCSRLLYTDSTPTLVPFIEGRIEEVGSVCGLKSVDNLDKRLKSLSASRACKDSPSLCVKEDSVVICGICKCNNVQGVL